MNKWKQRNIKNFQPNKKEARKLINQRIKSYLKIVMFFFIFEIIIIALTWTLKGKDMVKIIGIILTSFNFLVTAIYFSFIDMSPAKIMKKNKFKGQGIKNIEEGHTYYFALKTSGIIRLIINMFITSIIIAIIIATFLI